MLRKALGNVWHGLFPPLRSYTTATLPVVVSTPDRTSRVCASHEEYIAHPAVTLVNILVARPSSTTLGKALRDAGVSVEEHAQWKSVLEARTVADALQVLQHHQATTEGTDDAVAAPLPAWILLSILRKRMDRPLDALHAHHLAQSQLQHTPADLAPLVLNITTLNLSMHDLFVPLRTTVFRLLRTSRYIHPFHVRTLLRTLATTRPSREIQDLIYAVVKDANRRHITLSPSICRDLLENPAAHPRLVNVLKHSLSADTGTRVGVIKVYSRHRLRRATERILPHISAAPFDQPLGEHQRSLPPDLLRCYMSSFRNTEDLDVFLRKVIARQQKNRPAKNAQVDDSKTPSTAPSSSVEAASGFWVEALATAARHPDTSSAQLQELLARSMTAIPNQFHRLQARFLVIKGLLRRTDYESAFRLLGESLRSKSRFTRPMLTIAVETLTMDGHADDALRLLLEVTPRSLNPEHGKPRMVDIRTINTFLASLHRMGRPDAVFYLWDTMERVFDLQPDAVTTAILFKSARFARKCEGLQDALVDLGLAGLLSHKQDADATTQDRDAAIAGLSTLLKDRPHRTVNGLWRGERAGVVACRIARDIFIGNWPILQKRRPPIHPHRQSSSDPALSPISDFVHSIVGTRQAPTDAALPSGHAPQPYPTIVPHDPMFRAYIDLLASEDRVPEVPLVLEWMRYLHVRPSRSTIATALTYWGEVSLDAPWLERMKGGRANSSYAMLETWLTGWLGKGNMPKQHHMQAALQRIRFVREMASFGPAQRSEADGR